MDDYLKWMKGPLPEVGESVEWRRSVADPDEGTMDLVVKHTRLPNPPGEQYAFAYHEEWRMVNSGDVVNDLQGLIRDEDTYRRYLHDSNLR